VNVATVHYYFRTKEAIVAVALPRFFEPVLGTLHETLALSMAPKDKLLHFLSVYTTHFRTHPGVFMSLLEAIGASARHLPQKEPNAYQKVLLQLIGGAKGRMLSLISDISGLTDERQLVYLTLRTMTSVLHPLLISTLPSALFGLNLDDEATWMGYLRSVVDSLDSPAVPRHLKGHELQPD
jgi:AcrR family transcriptional regulator